MSLELRGLHVGSDGFSLSRNSEQRGYGFLRSLQLDGMWLHAEFDALQAYFDQG